MAVAHLVAAFLDPSSSPVLAVGTAVIDATPTPVKEWAVSTFGTADKPILIGSVLLVTIALAAVIGVVARRRLLLGIGLMSVLVVLAGAAVLRRPLASAADLVPTLLALVLGPLALVWLTRQLNGLTSAPDRPDPAGPAPRGEDAAGVAGEHRAAPVPAAAAGASRRGVLVGSGLLALLSAAAVAGGELIVRGRTRLADIALPKPANPQPPLPTGLEEEFPSLSSFRTPNSRFYRVDTKLAVPIVDPDDWELRIDGDVDRELTFSYDDLRRMEIVEHDITLTCVSNEVGGKLVGAARWTGVPLGALLDQAGVGTRADQILSTDVEGFTISTPLEVALDGRNSMVALGMNGEVLPRKHGFPARLVVPGLYGFVGATKWLNRLTLTTYDAATAYWTDRGWATDAPIKLSSRIDTPRPLATLAPGRVAVGGVAWAQHHGVAKVEVRIDGGPWQEARLGPSAGIDYWRQWHFPWDAQAGRHELAVRCTDRDGNVQTAERATPFPDGSSGIQEIVVMVD
jgi:DMSO/TMAO reductase YedYZ molybdopterin-dependent catalytic subunit